MLTIDYDKASNQLVIHFPCGTVLRTTDKEALARLVMAYNKYMEIK
jgi:hypothetical protein